MTIKTNAGARQKEIKDLEAGGLSLDQAAAKWALATPGTLNLQMVEGVRAAGCNDALPGILGRISASMGGEA